MCEGQESQGCVARTSQKAQAGIRSEAERRRAQGLGGLAFATAVGISPLSFGTDHGLWMGQGQLGTIASFPNSGGAPHPCRPGPSTLPDARLQAPRWELELLLNTFCVSSCGGGCAVQPHATTPSLCLGG